MANIPQKIGINLGNSLDAIGGETAWGNPLTTQAMIASIAARGFHILRIPVTWTEHLGPAPDYIIDPAWMARVRQVVDWALDAGLTPIVNTHHDNTLLQPVFSNMPRALQAFCAIWTQIAQAFRDAPPHLIFEGLNEPRPVGVVQEWTGGTLEARQCINVLQQAFVDIVRASGGNNAQRLLLVTTSAAVISDESFDGFLLPKGENIGLSLHAYEPARFCYDRPQDHPTALFGEGERHSLDELFEKIRRLTKPLGVPVWITEFGAVAKTMPGGGCNDEACAAYAEHFVRHAQAQQIPCIWWDNNFYAKGDEWFGLFDRQRLSWYRPAVAAALLDEH